MQKKITNIALRSNTNVLIIAAALAISLSMGIRSTFGLFQTPMNFELGFDREIFGFAMALQQLLWGLFQPICGMIADRYGSGRVIVGGAIIYSFGLFVMSGAETPFVLNIGGGWLIGFGLAATSFSVVLGALGRLVPVERQSVAFGIASAGGSFGQFIMAPLGQQIIQTQGWSQALIILSVVVCAIIISAAFLQSKASDKTYQPTNFVSQTMREALAEAAANRSYQLLTIGFFVCGFQVAFLAMHLPAYLQDAGMTARTSAIALALIGFFNIVGTYACGVLGGIFPKRYILSLLYFTRAIVFSIFISFPVSEGSVYLFSIMIGLLWLGTVPLTSALVAKIFGAQYMATLFGIVYFGHQLGSFFGVWIGGYLFDEMNSYELVWYGSILLGFIAALMHLPIREVSLQRAKA
ncbi:MAG: MFS transporter [Magnetovibrio sp.]|nr:MFS transporter [Magnetovibrio sp.]MBH90360.1 MFS transporter [Magnetovibrio sp.]|tara:strand:- start:1635 stop:2861 length:1227 start_codon:yes stop_codon:yes gene_type:complete